MRRITTILLAGSAAIFLSACGGGSSGGGSSGGSSVDTSNNATLEELANNGYISISYNVDQQSMDRLSDALYSTNHFINEREIKDAGNISCSDIDGLVLIYTDVMDSFIANSYISGDYARSCDEIIYTDESLFGYGPYSYASSYSVNL